MNEYLVDVVIRVSVSAFDEKDALEAVHDCFGEGEICGLVVQDFEVTDYELLG
jgi:hypothetical protein